MRTVASLLTVLGAFVVLVTAPSGTAALPTLPDVVTPPIHSTDLLRHAGGVLWWITPQCDIGREQMSTLQTTTAGSYCRAWPSPDGSEVLASNDTIALPSPFHRLVVLNGTTLRRTAKTPLSADDVASPLAWSPSVSLAALCVTRHTGGPARPAQAPSISLLSPPWQRVLSRRNRCYPSFTADNTLLSTDGERVFDGSGDLQLGPALDVAAGRPRHGYVVTALAALHGDGQAVAVTPLPGGGSTGQSAIDVIGRTDASSAVIRASDASDQVTAITIAPDNSALAYQLSSSPKRQYLYPLRPGSLAAGVPPRAWSYAWSPDGRYIAVATAHDIKVFDRRTGATGEIDVRNAGSLTWTR